MWILKHQYALIIAGVLLFISLSWIVPPQATLFVVQRQLQEIWIVLLGIGSIPFYVAVVDSPIAAVLVLVICILLLTLVTQYLWLKGWKGILLFFTLFIVNIFIGAFMLAFGFGDGNLASKEATVECETIDESGEGVRLVSYFQSYADGGFTQYFFSTTNNNGENWSQIGSVAYSSCEKRHQYGTTDFNFNTCMPEKDAHPAWICLENTYSP